MFWKMLAVAGVVVWGVAWTVAPREDARTSAASAPVTAQVARVPATASLIGNGSTTGAYALTPKVRYVTPAAWVDQWGAVRYPAFVQVEPGDFDGDGREEFAVVMGGLQPPDFEQLWIFPQLPDGTIGPVRRVTLSSPSMSSVVGTTVADFNEDGATDMLITRMWNFELVLSDGHGGWTKRAFVGHPLMASYPALAIDADRDGHLDIVAHFELGYGQVAADPQARLITFRGDGTGGFVPMRETITGAPTEHDRRRPLSMSAGDLNRDGKAELVMYFENFDYLQQRWSRTIEIAYPDGAGGYAVPVPFASANDGIRAAIFDYDADGRLDILETIHGIDTDQRLWVYRQGESGAFPAVPTLRHTAYVEPVAMEVGDLDRDGKQDLVIPFDGQLRIGYYLQRGNALAPPVYVNAGFKAGRYSVNSIALGDFNHDGCTDAVVSATYDGLYLMMGSKCGKMRRTGGRGQAVPAS